MDRVYTGCILGFCYNVCCMLIAAVAEVLLVD